MRSRVALAVVAALLAVAAGPPGTGRAAQRPVAQNVLSRGAISRKHPIPVGASRHNIFGTIVRIGTAQFVLRTRTGRLLLVDTTIAMRLGSYSAPLFVGKIVLVGGSIDALRVFRATTVTRMTRLDSTTPADT